MIKKNDYFHSFRMVREDNKRPITAKQFESYKNGINQLGIESQQFDAKLEEVRCMFQTDDEPQCHIITDKSYPYCRLHCAKCLHLLIKTSTIIDEDGKSIGPGLFAFHHKDTTANKDGPVFKKGDKIVNYFGDKIGHDELIERYGILNTGRYAIADKSSIDETRRTYIDASVRRCIASNVNHKREVDCNIAFKKSNKGDKYSYLVAKKDIYNLSELFVNYGTAYNLRHINSETNRGVFVTTNKNMLFTKMI